MFEQLLEDIKTHSTIIIHRHSNPDGDALGSQVGLYHLIRTNWPDKDVYMVGDDSRRYGFIAPMGMDEIPDELFGKALGIVLDTGTSALISDSRYQITHRTARIDHHIFSGKICDTEIIRPEYESCAGLITAFAMECGLITTREAASALFTGIVTDSGRFRYDSTTNDTFARVSFLMARGIDTESIYQKLYRSDFKSLKMKAYFIDQIRFTEHNVGYIYTTKDELDRLCISAFGASRGYVNTMADIEGVDIWVAFAEGEDGVLCELRSSGPNINPIAVKYGGGGHEKASGATVKDKKSAMAMLKDLDAMVQGA